MEDDAPCAVTFRNEVVVKLVAGPDDNRARVRPGKIWWKSVSSFEPARRRFMKRIQTRHDRRSHKVEMASLRP